MTEDYGELVSSLDQPILFDPTPVLDDVDRFYEQALSTDNPALTLLTRAKEILAGFRASGLALAKLLYLIKTDWDKFGINENFENVVYAIVGLKRVTTDRYLAVWRMFAENLIPEPVQPYILSLQMRSQVPIAKTLSQGYTLTDADWERIINAPDGVSLRNELRTIKKQPMRKSGVMFTLRQNGDLFAIDSEHVQHYVGWLDVESKDETVIRLIDRIVDSSYITRE